jgi:predicted thioesterase
LSIAAQIPIGASATRSVVVTRELTEAHSLPDMPEVYGTPMMVYLMETAAAAAIEGFLPAGWVSVGIAVDVRHLAATPVGLTITAKATVVAVGDNTITFDVEAHDGVEAIGAGTHTRAPIDLARFARRVQAKAAGAR